MHGVLFRLQTLQLVKAKTIGEKLVLPTNRRAANKRRCGMGSFNRDTYNNPPSSVCFFPYSLFLFWCGKDCGQIYTTDYRFIEIFQMSNTTRWKRLAQWKLVVEVFPPFLTSHFIIINQVHIKYKQRKRLWSIISFPHVYSHLCIPEVPFLPPSSISANL